MDLLAGYKSTSDDEDESDTQKKDASQSQASSSEDEDKSPKEDVKKRKQKATKSLLPSVDSLFSSTSGPAFLGGKKDDFEVVHFKKQKKISEASVAAASAPLDKVAPPLQVQLPTTKPSMQGAKEHKERLNRKERVKGQRLKGQVSYRQSH